MLLYLLLALACFGWSTAAPAEANTFDNHIPNGEVDLNQFTLPNFSEVSTDYDVNKTVEQVEQILKAYPSLPRLSKSDILVLLKNITTEDKMKNQKEKLRKDKAISRNKKNKGGRSLMVVLPYKAEDTDNGDMTELYTKPPIIKYISPNPIVVTDEDDNDHSDSEQKEIYHKNHKYTDSKTESNILKEGDNFWQDQTQKLMNDLKKKNKSTVKKDTNETPFKKMPSFKIPDDFTKRDVQNIEYDVVSEDSTKSSNNPSTPINLDMPFIPIPSSGLVGPVASELISNPSVLPSFDDQTPQDSVYLPPDTSSFGAFKPLPSQDSGSNVKNLDELLDQFGILDSVNRGYLPVDAESYTKTPKSAEYIKDMDFVDTDMFPAGMASLLTDMGLGKKKGRKMIGNGQQDSSGEESVSNESFQLDLGPDPMSVEELTFTNDQTTLDMQKRQESNTSSTEIAETTTASSSSSDAERSGNNESPAVADLESSFGGSPADDDPSEAVLPPPRKNGFYYMLDWNSFLEVGDGDTKVNIRFDPKLGDPQRFLAVTVP